MPPVYIKSVKRKEYIKQKRIYDIILSFIGITATMPIMIICGILIIIDDPDGSPIYSQIRIGKDGKKFRMYKLRTMKKNAHDEKINLMHMNESDGPTFKIEDDPRITKFGKILRKTSLDELPQLYNVLLGDMSLVGPRPPLPEEISEYLPWQKKRLSVTPGITCYWQISDNRNDISFDDWVKMDIRYINEMSFFTDLKILLKTVCAVLKMNGR